MDNKQERTEEKIRIYAMTHKKFQVPEDPLYVPLQVGRAGKEDLGYLTDATGDHISDQNCYYSELTGFYWIWKNVTDLDYVGTCHYRRYLMNERGAIFQKNEILELLQSYDLITSHCIELNYSYEYGFSDNHNPVDLQVTGEVIRELYPAYYGTFCDKVSKNRTYFGNIMICSKALFDQYCSWLFDIFFHVQERIHVEDYDQYHKRVFGFISEFLLYVYVTYHHLKAYECKVALIGEKVETREMKKQLAVYFHERDIQGAKQYFLAYRAKRPDVLMEASDVTGDLRVAMQVIATADAEHKAKGSSILDHINDFEELVRVFKILNGIVIRMKNGTDTDLDLVHLKQLRVSKQALNISILTFCKNQKEKDNVLQILQDNCIEM